jgi:hypothetical protein
MPAPQTITEYPVPTPASVPFDITAGPDGNLWFTEFTAGIRTIARITPDGAITEFPLPPNPRERTVRYRGGLRREPLVHSVASVGRSREFRDWPDHAAGRRPPDVPLPDGSGPLGIAAGPDGNLWFVLSGTNAHRPHHDVRRRHAVPDPDGRELARGDRRRIRRKPLVHRARCEQDRPHHDVGGRHRVSDSDVRQPTRGNHAGPDGAIWFNELAANQIGRITTAGAFTEFPVPTPNAFPEGGEIVAGPDGNLWFTENSANKIGRMTTSGCRHGIRGPDGQQRALRHRQGTRRKHLVHRGARQQCRPITTGQQDPARRTATTLCLSNGRFSVTASFRVASTDTATLATAVSLTGDSGYFWFFGPNNVELVVKVLNAWCAVRLVLVLRGRTDRCGSRNHDHGQAHGARRRSTETKRGTPFAPIQDTSAFSTCP